MSEYKEINIEHDPIEMDKKNKNEIKYNWDKNL